jgi:hypothetical protein
MTPFQQCIIKHLTISVSLYILFASLDVHFTLTGINGDISLEGNPIMQYMMLNFGLGSGLIIGKAVVFCLALIVALIAVLGIEKRADWVYYLALTQWTKNWMKRKRRYWVAFVPLYFIAFFQGVAFTSWVWLML